MSTATPKDPYANPRHIVVYVAALVLGIITFILAFGLSKVTTLPDITDIFPKQNTAMLVMIDPSSSSDNWQNNQIYKSIEKKVIDHFTAISKSDNWRSDNDVLGYALINTAKGLEPVYITSSDFSNNESLLKVNGYYISAKGDLQYLLSPSFNMSLSSIDFIANTRHVLPIDQTIKIFIQPSLMASSLPQLKATNADVRSAISLIGPQIADLPLSIMVFHMSDNMAAVTVAMSPTVNYENANIKNIDNYSTISLNEPYSFITNGGDLLLANILTVKYNAEPEFYRQVLESNQLTIGVNQSSSVVYARRPLGWSPEKELITQNLKDYVRNQSSWISKFTLPDKTVGQEILGPKDEEIEIVSSGEWIVAKYDENSARAKINGPELIIQYGEQLDIDWSQPQERVLQATIRNEDINSLLGKLLPDSDESVEIIFNKLWYDLNADRMEIDAAALESADLIRFRWQEKEPMEGS